MWLSPPPPRFSYGSSVQNHTNFLCNWCGIHIQFQYFSETKQFYCHIFSFYTWRHTAKKPSTWRERQSSQAYERIISEYGVCTCLQQTIYFVKSFGTYILFIRQRRLQWNATQEEQLFLFSILEKIYIFMYFVQMKLLQSDYQKWIG